jgi:hypothetical protein
METTRLNNYGKNQPSKNIKDFVKPLLSVLGMVIFKTIIETIHKKLGYDNLAHFWILIIIVPLGFLYLVLATGSMQKAKETLYEYIQGVKRDYKGLLFAIALVGIAGLVIAYFLGISAISVAFSSKFYAYIPRVLFYGVFTILCMLAFVEFNKDFFKSPIYSVILYMALHSIFDLIASNAVSSILMEILWHLVVGFSILAKRQGFATGIALFFYAVISCNLMCFCEKYNIAGFTFVTEPATGLNETMGLLFALLVAGMAYLAHYFYEYAYAYSLPMKEVVEKTKFAYQRTWGGKPLVIAELLPLLKKNRENIKVWTDAVISHEDYAKSRTMSCNESYYGVHGFENGKWHRFDDGLLVHAETTSNREGRFRLNYRWPAYRYLIKVIEKEKIYVGIFAVVKTLEEVQSYGKAYNFNAPPNVLSRWTKAPLNFRCQCALLYDISTGEEAYIRYDVIDHPDGFRRNLRGFYGGITLD